MNRKNAVVAIAIAGAALLGLGAWSYWRYSPQRTPSKSPAASFAAPLVPASATDSLAETGKIHTPHFEPLTVPPVPRFLGNVATATDVKVSFFYEGDDRTPTDEMWYQQKSSIENDRGEQYLLIPDVIDSTYQYGPTEFSIFKNQESHAYQGIPFLLLNSGSNYSLQYVALKINHPELIGELWVEMGVDYRYDDDGDVARKESPSPALASSLFSLESVYACGPGIYLRKIGESKLALASADNGVGWYKLEKPISLANLPLNFCDQPPGNKKSKQPKNEDDEDDDDFDVQDFCVAIKDFAGGQLRLHILYQPNGAPGTLQIQAVNFILQDTSSHYYKPVIDKNLDRYYKAFLVDRNCLKSKQPQDCGVQ